MNKKVITEESRLNEMQKKRHALIIYLVGFIIGVSVMNENLGTQITYGDQVIVSVIVIFLIVVHVK